MFFIRTFTFSHFILFAIFFKFWASVSFSVVVRNHKWWALYLITWSLFFNHWPIITWRIYCVSTMWSPGEDGSTMLSGERAVLGVLVMTMAQVSKWVKQPYVTWVKGSPGWPRADAALDAQAGSPGFLGGGKTTSGEGVERSTGRPGNKSLFACLTLHPHLTSAAKYIRFGEGGDPSSNPPLHTQHTHNYTTLSQHNC